MQVVYLHGMNSSPEGFKARFLRERYPDLVAPAMSNDVAERLEVARKEVPAGSVIVGSSLGAVTALDLLRADPSRAHSLVLLAPAVGLHNVEPRPFAYLQYVASLTIPAGLPTVVIAAIRDETVPLSAVRGLVARSPEPRSISLVEIDDEHVLHSQEAQDTLHQAVIGFAGNRDI